MKDLKIYDIKKISNLKLVKRALVLGLATLSAGHFLVGCSDLEEIPEIDFQTTSETLEETIETSAETTFIVPEITVPSFDKETTFVVPEITIPSFTTEEVIETTETTIETTETPALETTMTSEAVETTQTTVETTKPVETTTVTTTKPVETTVVTTKPAETTQTTVATTKPVETTPVVSSSNITIYEGINFLYDEFHVQEGKDAFIYNNVPYMDVNALCTLFGLNFSGSSLTKSGTPKINRDNSIYEQIDTAYSAKSVSASIKNITGNGKNINSITFDGTTYVSVKDATSAFGINYRFTGVANLVELNNFVSEKNSPYTSAELKSASDAQIMEVVEYMIDYYKLYCEIIYNYGTPVNIFGFDMQLKVSEIESSLSASDFSKIESLYEELRVIKDEMGNISKSIGFNSGAWSTLDGYSNGNLSMSFKVVTIGWLNRLRDNEFRNFVLNFDSEVDRITDEFNEIISKINSKLGFEVVEKQYQYPPKY